LNLTEMVGNDQTKTQLIVSGQAAVAENRPVPHTLMGGAAGCGKTTAARGLAQFLDAVFIQADPATLKASDDFVSIIKQLPQEGYGEGGVVTGNIKQAVLFLDEIHNMPLKGQELLGIAMENWVFPVNVKKKARKEKVMIWLPRFTVVGATTMTGGLSKPLRDRFKLQFQFKTYSLDESEFIVVTHAAKMGLDMTQEAAKGIANRGRGVPRVLVRFLERARDHARVLTEDGKITKDVVEAMFSFLEIGPTGLTSQDHRLLECLYDNKDVPVGLDSLAVILDECPTTISRELEPYLIRRGLLMRSSRGRLLTEEGDKYISSIMGKGTKEEVPTNGLENLVLSAGLSDV